MVDDLKTKIVTPDGVRRVSVEKTEGMKVTFVTPNWCDPLTWYYDSKKVSGKELTHVSGNVVYRDPDGKSWIDNYHGRYSNEDFLETRYGDIPRLVVYVGGVVRTEQDPHFGYGGDFVVEYGALGGAKVTFSEPQSGSITADCWEVSGSVWKLSPSSGKKLKIVSVEAQFSMDVSLRDTVKFQPRVGGAPFGSPALYKRMMDYINESNGALPIIPASSAPSTSWRDLMAPVVTYPWDYQAVTNLPSSVLAEIEISLEHDEPFSGSVATATFYCLSQDE